ncbi:MAG: transglutaminase-like domain-containing protein [Acidobacteria bacterium]|nr:transglutaminase-like domain-containing protein [Acidobacteriota bacterium]
MRPALGNTSSYSVPLQLGDAGTEQTIAAIRDLVDEALRDPVVRQTAGFILSRVEPYNDVAEVRALYDWVKSNIRFTKDPVGKETLSSARWILTHRFGDCDEINAILLPALLGVTGYRTRLVTIAGHLGAPDQFSHVYAEVFLREQWIPVDAARPGARFGVAPPHYFRKRVWSLAQDFFEDVRGLNGYHLGFDWGEFFRTGLPQITRSATDIIATARAPSTSLVPGASYQFPTALPATAIPSTGFDTSSLLLVAAVLGGAYLLAKR